MKATKYVITKTTQQEKQLLESLVIAGRKRIERINSAEKELESLIKAAELTENQVQRRSAVDIIQNKNKLRQKLEELRRVEVPKHRYIC